MSKLQVAWPYSVQGTESIETSDPSRTMQKPRLETTISEDKIFYSNRRSKIETQHGKSLSRGGFFIKLQHPACPC